jgi:hypothetical protein
LATKFIGSRGPETHIELELEQSKEEGGEDYMTNYYASNDKSDGDKDG